MNFLLGYMMSGLVTILATASTTVSYSDMSSIIDAVTSQFSVANIVSLLASAITAVVGFVFLWWGIRKLFRMITKAATRGKAAI